MTLSVHIVIADDGIRDVMVRVVRKLGAWPVLWGSAEEFLRDCAVGQVDCLMVDDDLLTMSGLSMLEQCVQRRPTARVVLLLGAHDADTASRVVRLGIATIEKPFDVRKLADAIRCAQRENANASSPVPAPPAIFPPAPVS